jgi:hypothetical protein
MHLENVCWPTKNWSLEILWILLHSSYFQKKKVIQKTAKGNLFYEYIFQLIQNKVNKLLHFQN